MVEFSIISYIISFVLNDFVEVSGYGLKGTVSHCVDEIEHGFLLSFLVSLYSLLCAHRHGSWDPVSVEVTSHILDQGFLHVLEIEDLVVDSELVEPGFIVFILEVDGFLSDTFDDVMGKHHDAAALVFRVDSAGHSDAFVLRVHEVFSLYSVLGSVIDNPVDHDVKGSRLLQSHVLSDSSFPSADSLYSLRDGGSISSSVSVMTV